MTKSYKNDVEKQTNLLEKELARILYNVRNSSAKTKQYLIVNYVKWMIYIIQKQKKILDIKYKMRSRKSGELIIQKEKELFSEVEHGITMSNTIRNYSELPSNIFSFIDDNPTSKLKVSSTLINVIYPSQLFKCFVNVHCTRVDPEGYWMDRWCLTDKTKSSDRSLLKVVLFQTLNKIIRFSNNELTMLLNYELDNFDQLLSDNMNSPFLENHTAIMLLAAEYFHSY